MKDNQLSKNLGVKSYIVYSTLLIKCLEDNRLYVDDEGIAEDVESQSIQVEGGMLYFISKAYRFNLYEFSTKRFIRGQHGISFVTLNENTCLSSYSIERIDNKFQWKTGFLDLKKDEIIQAIPQLDNCSVFVPTENGFIFSSQKGFLGNFHLPTETTLWQYDTSVLGIEKIGKILGVFGEVLAVGIRIGPTDSGLIALNISNGQLVWQQMFSKSGLGLNLSHSTQHNTLISLGGFSIWEFDLLEQKVIRDKDLAHKLVYNDRPFKISSATLDQGKFYFVAQYVGQSMSSALLGIFNTETEELEWIHDFEGKVHLGGNARPKVGGDKIYTLDNNNTLHIFERG